jgi:tetratricopeptide (TPR) repeat protein
MMQSSALLDAGDSAAARAAAARAVEEFDALAAAEPAAERPRYDLASALETVGQACGAGGDAACALRSYRRALSLLERLAAGSQAAPAPPELVSEVALARFLVGGMLLRTGDPRGAIASHEAARDARRTLLESNPGDGELRKQLAESWDALGDAEMDLAQKGRDPSRWRAARASFAEATALYGEMQRRGQLPPPLAGVLAELAGKIARCDAALRAS